MMKQIFTSVLLAAVLTFGIVQSAPPKFESNYDTKVFVEGSSAWLVCSATSDDSPNQYKWFDRNGDAIASNSKNEAFGIRETAEGSRLTFVKVAKAQEGIYRCTAENEHGLVSKIFEIKVNSGAETGNGNLTVEDVHAFNVTDTSVQFVIRASHFVAWYMVRYYEKMYNSSVKTMAYYDETNQSGGIPIDGLIPSGLYTFRVQVEAKNGDKSEWSKPIEVVLLPYTPTLIIRGLSGNTVQVEWSAKRNDISRSTVDGYMLSYGYINDKENWTEPKCMIKIQLPKSCSSLRSYTITNLWSNEYYEIQLQAHTRSGYGKPAIMRVRAA